MMYEYFISLAYDLPGLPALESNLLAAATVLEFTLERIAHGEFGNIVLKHP